MKQSEDATSFVLVGQPGSGKTTVATIFSQETGKPLLVTDDLFDHIRRDLTHPAVCSFMCAFEAKNGYSFDAEMLPKDAEFKDRYGIETYRDFHEIFLAWVIQSGISKNHVLDLGGSAYMRSHTRLAARE